MPNPILFRMVLMNQAAVHVPPAPSGYTGPGDVVSGAYAWYGLRGYTAAYSTGSNPALDLVDQAGANQITVNILSDGRLDVASISAWVTANSVSTIKVKRWYDQSGNARHLNQATLTNMPVLNLTGFGSLPAVTITGTVPQTMATSTGSFAQSQPITYSFVYIYGGREGEAFSHAPTFINTVSGGFKVRAGNNPSASTAANGSCTRRKALSTLRRLLLTSTGHLPPALALVPITQTMLSSSAWQWTFKTPVFPRLNLAYGPLLSTAPKLVT